MPSIANNINNNSSVVNVGRTTPVSPGQQPAAKSIPVVLATDQSPVPVEEQNKVQSEVALSLLGIPRAEVALGIFADVNTYDVNPSEWSSFPEAYVKTGVFARGIKHLPNEAGALVTAPRNQNAVLTSKRFFRYQPGRVSAATFGIKTTVSLSSFAQNPTIRKFGIFDNFDGYYWENRQDGKDDNFGVIRRTQSLLKGPTSTFGTIGTQLRGDNPTEADTIQINQQDDYRIVGKAPADTSYLSNSLFERDRQTLTDKRFDIVNAALSRVVSEYGTDANGDTYYAAIARNYNTYSGLSLTATDIEKKCKRDVDYWVDFFLLDLQWGGTAHTSINLTNFITGFNLLGTSQTNATYGLSNAAVTKLQTLTDIVIAGFGNTTVDDTRNGVQSTTIVQNFTLGNRSTLDFGSRNELDTIYDVKNYYWGYFVARFQDPGGSDPFASSEPGNYQLFQYFALTDTAQSNPITDDNAIIYSKNGRDFTLAEVKYKCQRDIGYLIEGFKNDISGGGDAETKYNMSMYFEGNGMSINSQSRNEILRHTHLKKVITYDLDNKFGFADGTSVYDKQETLSQRTIDNFTVEDTKSIEVGARGYAGNLIVQRDSLIMVHAGVYDTNLLKEQKEIFAELNSTDNTVRLTQGVVTFGQHVKYVGDDNGDLVNGKLYKVNSVIGPKGNEFTLEKAGPEAGDTTTVNINIASDTNPSNAPKFILVNPFVFPREYDPAYYTNGNPDPYGTARPALSPDPFPKGMMFPYQYQEGQNLSSDNTQARVGYINTVPIGIANDTAFASQTRTQIDKVNFIPEYINWIKNNVKPEFYGVYEYRVPRTRFSHDKLDGKNGTADDAFTMVFSDITTASDGTKTRPGQLFNDGEPSVSLYNFDFTKVTMLKIEFSWYGAVGALFLAYVPVSNGEARWVRVHHLRASNQLKIASLGNATLPITYNVFGGGDFKNLGDKEEPEAEGGENTLADTGYGDASHNLVKYGASYYIDGGDRGTVRLFSYNNEDVVPAYGKQWSVTSGGYTASDSDTDNNPSLLINPTTLAGNVGNGITQDAIDNFDPRFFIYASVKTDDKRDQGVFVKWVDVSTGKLELSGPLNNTASIRLLPDRANCVYGLETKEVILSTVESNSVRNRVQVYPTRLSSSNLGDNPVRLRMKKTPRFQTNVTTSGSFTLSAQHTITAENFPLSTTLLNPTSPPDSAPTESSAPYIQNGEELFGWFKAKLDGLTSITPFGRLYKKADQYFFELLETYNGTVTLLAGEFLPDGRFNADGTVFQDTRVEDELDGLSSIVIAENTAVPIPGTGINIATIYLIEGTEQLDLSPYFNYNKEYLSFPLTDQADTLYFAVDSDSAADSPVDNISLGVTWEEQ